MVRSEHLKSVALLIASAVFALLLGELLVRAFGTDAARWRLQNFAVDPSLSDSRARTMQPHPLLGYVPRPGYRWVGADGRSVTFDDEGFRQHHALDPAPANGEPLLVTGDSYAMGEEVSDDETIPAHLEQTLGRPVINAGVSGYGLDQVVLRSEALVPRLQPAILVVTFIADDVWRAAQRILWGVPKPYFEIADGALVLRNEPLPQPADRRRLARLADSGVRVMVVAEYTPQAWPGQPYHRAEEQVSQPVLACAREAGLETVDVLPALTAEVARVGVERLYRAGHMRDIGNRWSRSRSPAASVSRFDVGARACFSRIARILHISRSVRAVLQFGWEEVPWTNVTCVV